MPQTPAQKSRARDLYLQRTYGITLAEYSYLLGQQGGCCAICESVPKKRNLVVDHNHKTGQVRGLLCNKCNHDLLGGGRENPTILRRAAKYLEAPPYTLGMDLIRAVGPVVTGGNKRVR